MRKPGRLRAGKWLRLASLLAGLGVVAGCPATADQVAPPAYDFYFPTGLVLSPDERYMFVLSANSDLQFSSGAVQVIDLDVIDQIADSWKDSPLDARVAPDQCSAPDFGPVPTRPTVLACPTSVDGAPVSGVVANAGIQIGSFGVSAAVQPLLNGDGSASSLVRLFFTVRGDPSITWADFDTGTVQLDCGGVAGGFDRCDEAHRLARIRNDGDLPSLSTEPFGLAIDAVGQHGYVTHLTTGTVSLIAAPNQVGSFPVLADEVSNLWGISILNGTLGSVGVAARTPGDPDGLVYVTSQSEARVSMVHAVDHGVDENGLPLESLIRTGSFFLDGLTSAGDPGDARTIAFSPDGNRAYFISRTPPSLQAFDTSLDSTGAPRNLPMGVLELCEQPANLSLVDFGEGPRAVLPCFQTGRLWVVDTDHMSLVAVEDTGRGPSGIATSVRHKKIYVGNYAEDTLTIIDAAPGAATQYRSIMRLGKLRVVGN